MTVILRTVITSAATPQRTVRRWVVPEDGQQATTVSSFMQLPFWTEKNGFNAINSFQVIGVAGGPEEQYLIELQRPYENDGWGYTAEQKAGWLINRTGGAPNSPYFYKDGNLVYGTCLMSGNKIEIEPTEYIFQTRYRTEPISASHPVTFYKVLGLRRSEMGSGYTFESHPTKIHNIGTAWTPNSGYTANTPKGKIVTPVWDARDFPCAAGALYYAKVYTE